jgi:hypothetical protein
VRRGRRYEATFDCEKARKEWLTNDDFTTDPSCAGCTTTTRNERKRVGRRWKTVKITEWACRANLNLHGFTCHGYYSQMSEQDQKSYRDERFEKICQKKGHRGRCAKYKTELKYYYRCDNIYTHFQTNTKSASTYKNFIANAKMPTATCGLVYQGRDPSSLFYGCNEGRFIIPATKNGVTKCFMVEILLENPKKVNNKKYTAARAYPMIYELGTDACPSGFQMCNNQCLARPNVFERMGGKTQATCTSGNGRRGGNQRSSLGSAVPRFGRSRFGRSRFGRRKILQTRRGGS